MTRWKPYAFLWRSEKNKRELLSAGLPDFDRWLRRHSELEARLDTEPQTTNFFSSLLLSAERLKTSLRIELKSSTQR